MVGWPVVVWLWQHGIAFSTLFFFVREAVSLLLVGLHPRRLWQGLASIGFEASKCVGGICTHMGLNNAERTKFWFVVLRG
jgi:hypothetical protein